jgi:hypothetical protein
VASDTACIVCGHFGMFSRNCHESANLSEISITSE